VLQFERVGNAINMGQNFQGMGIARGDYDNDGDLDYYRSNIGAGYLSTNNGAGMFLSVLFATDPVPFGDGPAAPGCAGSPMGWGPVFFDPDNDGDVDLLRVNGDSVSYFNNNAGQLETSRSDTGINGRGNGLAISDFDGDTDMDVLIHSSTGQIGLFANNTANAGNALLIKLNGLSPNRDAIGAIIQVNANSTQQMREISAGASHGSSHSFVQHFGLGSDTFATSVSISWPSGCTQVLNNIAASTAQGGAYTVEEKDAPCARVNGQIIFGDGSGAGGILVSAIDQTAANAGAIHGSTVTQVDGRFALAGLPLKTPMKLTVSKGGVAFTPTEGAVYLFNAGEQQIHDFTATALGGAVLGKVTDSSTAQGLLNVSVELNFGTTASILTDEIGDYRLAALTDYDYYLSASKPGYSIISNGPVTVDGKEVEKQFAATCLGGSMSGRVIDAATGNGIQGATVSLNFGAVAATTTDANGFYAFTGLTGYDYYVDASKVGFVIAGQGPVVVDGNCIDHKFSTVLN